jgi:hypothetical protein
MYTNGYKMKQNQELSPFQKRIEEIDNVILCGRSRADADPDRDSWFPIGLKAALITPNPKIRVERS